MTSAVGDHSNFEPSSWTFLGHGSIHADRRFGMSGGEAPVQFDGVDRV